MNTLSIKITNTYVGSWDHLEKWRDIGSFEVVRSHRVEGDPEDMCEPLTDFKQVQVSREAGVSDEDVRCALRDSFTKVGCSHDWDCCGCRSYRVSRIKPYPGDVWVVVIHSSRNY
jgi:hypothetical protein